jgi:DNA-binding transcriptional LysR family regulator
LETLSGLEIFVETAQRQSFVATGRKTGISASAISKSISRLEERVGVRLFQRSTRTVRLTSEGEVFLQRCRRILGEIQAAEDDLSALTTSHRGRLEKVLTNSLIGGSTFHVVWPSSGQMAPKVCAFVDFAVENFSKGLVS